jgi:hypothetical protein
MMVMPCGCRISGSILYLIDFARINASRTCYGASACRRDVAQICLQELKSSQQVSEHGLSRSINESAGRRMKREAWKSWNGKPNEMKAPVGTVSPYLAQHRQEIQVYLAQ